MDALIIVVSLVETGIDVWAQVSWNPNKEIEKRDLLRLDAETSLSRYTVEKKETLGRGIGCRRFRDQQQPVAFGAEHPLGARLARRARGAALPICQCLEDWGKDRGR